MRLMAMELGVVLCAAFLAGTAEAQQGGGWDFRARDVTRQQLEETLARYVGAAQSPAYSERLHARARTDADSIRARLQGGDLRVGDRIRLTVEGQPQLTADSFAVTSGPALVLPAIGSVALGGVLRSELEAHLGRAVDRVYRGAVTRARLLMRVAVLGGVGRPGYLALSSDALLYDAITAAGGPSPDAVLTAVYVERGRDKLFKGDSLLTAIGDSRTLADLGLVDGDRIVIPRKGQIQFDRIVQTLGYALSLPFSIIALGKIL